MSFAANLKRIERILVGTAALVSAILVFVETVAPKR